MSALGNVCGFGRLDLFCWLRPTCVLVARLVPRLCSVEEFAASAITDNSCDTAGDFFMWTRSSCANGFLVFPGPKNNVTTLQCRPSTAVGKVRCCADDASWISDASCDELRVAANNQNNPTVPGTGLQGGWTPSDPAAPTVCTSPFVTYDALGFVLLPDQRRVTNVSADRADRLCASSGARLCSSWELRHFLPTLPAGNMSFATPSTCVTSAGQPGVVYFQPSTDTLRCVATSTADVDFGVRCCADEASIVPERARSPLSCEALGLAQQTLASAEVCGSSTVNGSGCVTKPVVFAEASRICAAAGMRLCTYSELVRGEERGTGCDLNDKQLWSSTPCGRCGAQSYLTHSLAGLQDNGHGQRGCLGAALTANVRCCADANPVLTPPPNVATSTADVTTASSEASTPPSSISSGPSSTRTFISTDSSSGTTTSVSSTPRTPSASRATYRIAGVSPSNVKAENFVTAVVRAVEKVVGPKQLFEDEVTVVGIRAGSIVVDFAVVPLERFQDTVQCALRQAREDGSLVRELKKILSERQINVQPSESANANDTFVPCPACSAITDVQCANVLQAFTTNAPPTADPAKSSGSGGAGVGLIAGIVAVAVVALLITVIYLKRQRHAPKTIEASGARHTVAFENPIYDASEEGGAGGGHSDALYDNHGFGHFDEEETPGYMDLPASAGGHHRMDGAAAEEAGYLETGGEHPDENDFGYLDMGGEMEDTDG